MLFPRSLVPFKVSVVFYGGAALEYPLRSALDYFHRENDDRAIFARAYYLITISVHQAVYQRGRYQNRLFFDPAWIKRLAGKFSWLSVKWRVMDNAAALAVA